MFDKDRDAASYNAYAGNYEKHIRHLSSPLAEHICSLAQVKPGDHVLDIGTGSGVGARKASQIAGADGEVLGVDLSKGMIDEARRSIAGWEGRKPEFQVMDAESLELPDERFDAVISLCAVRHFPNIAGAISQMYRVLKPGGHLVVSFGYHRPIAPVPLSLYIIKRAYQRSIRQFKPQIIGPSYLTNLAEQLLPQPEQVVDTEWGDHNPQGALFRLIKESGLKQVQKSWWGHEVIYNSADEFWDAQVSVVTKVRKRVSEAEPEKAALLKQTFMEAAENVLKRNGKLVYPYGAFYVAGIKPKKEGE